MSDSIKHECGIALMRLLRPAGYYIDKYGSWDYSLRKMYLMMEKQHNRGQDGAGLAGIRIGAKPGTRYIHRQRSNSANPIKDVFSRIYPEIKEDPCDVWLGHLRYGTYGNYNIDVVHPVTRENNWRSRSLVMAGNFNLTNIEVIFNHLLEIGQNPVDFSDTITILENVGHFLDQEVERLYRLHKEQGLTKREISPIIEQELDVAGVLRSAAKRWDGGYVMAGMLGHGDAFVLRDPAGIRPAFWYADDEVVVAASERPVIQTVFDIRTDKVNELDPGKALIIKASGEHSLQEVLPATTPAKCSFERIYFSRGTDKHIYRERKKLGETLTEPVLAAVNHDVRNTVFSYIPNTAESAFYGLIEGVDKWLNNRKRQSILKKGDAITVADFERIMDVRPRIEKIAVKDIKLRTFITEDRSRDDLVAHVYDVTYGIIRRGKDSLVVIDDSIVRGTTLKESIIRILDRLDPAKIVIVSSSPQIRYPDCYGIDMSRLGDFIAFRAALELLKLTGREQLITDVYGRAKEELKKPDAEMVNLVQEIYAPFTDQEISNQIAVMLKTSEIKADLEIVFQSVEGLHKACPGHTGDWYFTGNYPTPGGNRVVNRAFVNYIEGRGGRAY
ncbi:MAG: amidophosphoribosyltransferase [Bacteroidales bacterium]|jgi:amidophosphoribosyltransferase|nr:amidophosphoribosyltransferase [Bacteroidales bacterium]MDX9928143.1 amidophosphoribosyltransferase [Bacteroidales bacterium]